MPPAAGDGYGVGRKSQRRRRPAAG